ncbi:MAG: twin-arginine translocation signal domain-containing protein [Coriobacteriales bacterium]|nr:twin-arginine translocation signal domain-containing protein [Coriobacteriales bacterium]
MKVDRRSFLKTAVAGGAALALGAGSAFAEEAELAPLPAPDPDPESMFGVDKNINMETIDQYVGRPDVCYRDVRMLFDPADYAAIGGNADLSATIKGFKIVPYPYLATLTALPVEGAYDAETLFSLEWDEAGNIIAAKPNYLESQQILDDLFPKDKAIFFMCGGGGYAGMTKALLIFLGWDPELLYNVGGNWGYTGENALELIIYSEEKDGVDIYATWRADYATIDFSRLHPAE